MNHVYTSILSTYRARSRSLASGAAGLASLSLHRLLNSPQCAGARWRVLVWCAGARLLITHFRGWRRLQSAVKQILQDQFFRKTQMRKVVAVRVWRSLLCPASESRNDKVRNARKTQLRKVTVVLAVRFTCCAICAALS